MIRRDGAAGPETDDGGRHWSPSFGSSPFSCMLSITNFSTHEETGRLSAFASRSMVALISASNRMDIGVQVRLGPTSPLLTTTTSTYSIVCHLSVTFITVMNENNTHRHERATYTPEGRMLTA